MGKKNTVTMDSIFGGLDRIRTGVEAFAELCLATRLQDREGKCNTNSKITKFPFRLIAVFFM
ncbi:MAG: hypothetical protein RIQ62_718 [Bacteroidota bacterium]